MEMENSTGTEQLSSVQRQRMDENKKKAKERLAAKASASEKTKFGRQVSRAVPGTPSQSKDNNDAERAAKQPATPIKSN